MTGFDGQITDRSCRIAGPNIDTRQDRRYVASRDQPLVKVVVPRSPHQTQIPDEVRGDEESGEAGRSPASM